ncbi:MAG: response regulator [Deltaproteobacteria bacterium]|nr:response regulator [Deltaproteobacteria bacterium]
MPQSILLIDAEQPFTDNIAGELRRHGLDVTVVGDGKEGLDKARKLDPRPALVVLCVELPKMSGYSICNKLKKDDDLKALPLIITSSEATPETFEQHKKLKTRADGYLIKPFDGKALFEQIKALIPVDGDAEEVMELDASEISEAGPEDGSVDLSDIMSEVDDEPRLETEEPVAIDAGGDGLDLTLDDEPLSLDVEEMGDSDLASFDSQFDNLSSEPAADLDAELGAPEEAKISKGDLDSLLDAEPEPEFEPEIEAPAPKNDYRSKYEDKKPAAAAVASSVSVASAGDSKALEEAERQLRDIRRQNTDLTSRVAELESRLKAAEEEARKKSENLSSIQSSTTSSNRELLAIKQQLHDKDKELFKLKEEAFSKEKAAFDAEDKLNEAQHRVDSLSGEIKDRDATITSLNAKVSALSDERDTIDRESSERIHKLEADLRNLAAERDSQVKQLEEQRTSQVKQLETQRDGLKYRLEQAEKTASERADRIETLSSELAQKEEQITELYRKSKSDEQIRDRARKAVEIANELLSGKVAAEDAELPA